MHTPCMHTHVSLHAEAQTGPWAPQTHSHGHRNTPGAAWMQAPCPTQRRQGHSHWPLTSTDREDSHGRTYVHTSWGVMQKTREEREFRRLVVLANSTSGWWGELGPVLPTSLFQGLSSGTSLAGPGGGLLQGQVDQVAFTQLLLFPQREMYLSILFIYPFIYF